MCVQQLEEEEEDDDYEEEVIFDDAAGNWRGSNDHEAGPSNASAGPELQSERILQLTFQPSFRGGAPTGNSNEEDPLSHLALDPSAEEISEVFGSHGMMDSYLGLNKKGDRKKTREKAERRKGYELPRHLAGAMGEANVLYASRQYDEAKELLMDVVRQVS